MKYLAGKGIMTKIYFSPVHETHFYQKILGYTCSLPITEKISKEIISLPFYPGITKEEMGRVVETISAFYGDA